MQAVVSINLALKRYKIPINKLITNKRPQEATNYFCIPRQFKAEFKVTQHKAIETLFKSTLVESFSQKSPNKLELDGTL